MKASEELAHLLDKTTSGEGRAKKAVNILMDIFKEKAEEAQSKEDVRRGQRKDAAAQRVQSEEKAEEEPPGLVPVNDESVASEQADKDAFNPDNELMVEGMEVQYPTKESEG